jgi:hypothetical protein
VIGQQSHHDLLYPQASRATLGRARTRSLRVTKRTTASAEEKRTRRLNREEETQRRVYQASRPPGKMRRHKGWSLHSTAAARNQPRKKPHRLAPHWCGGVRFSCHSRSPLTGFRRNCETFRVRRHQLQEPPSPEPLHACPTRLPAGHPGALCRQPAAHQTRQLRTQTSLLPPQVLIAATRGNAFGARSVWPHQWSVGVVMYRRDEALIP